MCDLLVFFSSPEKLNRNSSLILVRSQGVFLSFRHQRYWIRQGEKIDTRALSELIRRNSLALLGAFGGWNGWIGICKHAVI